MMRTQFFRSSKRCRGERRRGIAPLEYVMAMPLLVALTYVLFSLIRVTLNGMDVVEQARFQTFQSVNRVLPRQPLTLSMAPMDGATEKMPTRRVELSGWFAAGSPEVRSGNKALGGTWDHRQAQFPDRQTPFIVHRVPFELIAQNRSVGAGSYGIVFGFGQVMGVPGRISDTAGAAGRVMNGIVYAAGWYLEYVIGGTVGAAASILQTIIDITPNPFGINNWFLNPLKRAVGFFRAVAYSCHQVFRATEGKEVDWDWSSLIMILQSL
jgi:hypothetical protein